MIQKLLPSPYGANLRGIGAVADNKIVCNGTIDGSQVQGNHIFALLVINCVGQ